MPGRKEVRGAAAELTLDAGITNVATSLAANGTVSGWPTGTTYDFVIVVDKGLGTEEKILCDGLSGSNPATITVASGGRGYDGTTAVAHDAGATVHHCLDADSIDTLFAHAFDVTRHDHTQYLKRDGSVAMTGLLTLPSGSHPSTDHQAAKFFQVAKYGAHVTTPSVTSWAHGSFDLINWTAEVDDTDGIFDGNDTKLISTEAGTFLAICQLGLTHSGAESFVAFPLLFGNMSVNGTAVQNREVPVNDQDIGSKLYVQFNKILVLEENDEVEISFGNQTGDPFDMEVGAAETFFQMYRIGI